MGLALKDFAAALGTIMIFGSAASAGNSAAVAGAPGAAREAKLSVLTSNWTPKEKVSFAKLSAAAAGFSDARAENEIEQSGPDNAARTRAEKENQDQDFYVSLDTIEAKKTPKYTPAELRKENTRMNQSFVKLMKAKDTALWGTTTKNGIIKAQKAWVAYRNAWLEFAKVRYPGQPADSIDGWLTKKRNAMFDSLLGATAVE